jgi:LAO/AO transport system kinase
VATQGKGVPELVDAIGKHGTHLRESGAWRARRAGSARRQVQAIVEDRVRRRFDRVVSAEEWPVRFQAVAARAEDPYTVADDILARVAAGGDD